MYISTLQFHFFIKFNMILNMAGTGIINTDRIKVNFVSYPFIKCPQINLFKSYFSYPGKVKREEQLGFKALASE